MLDFEFPSLGSAGLIGMCSAVVGGLVTFLYRRQTLDDKREMNLAGDYRSRMELLEKRLDQCVTHHLECEQRVRRLEVAEEARKQNEDLHRQILHSVQSAAGEAITGRRAALDEISTMLDAKLDARFPAPPQTT
jgi:hypothetical protein